MIHAVGIGDVREHGIVKDQAAGIAHPGHHEDQKEPEPVGGKAQGDAANQSHAQKQQEDGLFVALSIGEGTEHRPQHCHQQGGSRRRIAPVGQVLHIGEPGLLRQEVEVDGNDGGNEQREGGIAHIIENPAALRRGEFQFVHAFAASCSGLGSKVRP